MKAQTTLFNLFFLYLTTARVGAVDGDGTKGLVDAQPKKSTPHQLDPWEESDTDSSLEEEDDLIWDQLGRLPSEAGSTSTLQNVAADDPPGGWLSGILSPFGISIGPPQQPPPPPLPRNQQNPQAQPPRPSPRPPRLPISDPPRPFFSDYPSQQGPYAQYPPQPQGQGWGPQQDYTQAPSATAAVPTVTTILTQTVAVTNTVTTYSLVTLKPETSYSVYTVTQPASTSYSLLPGTTVTHGTETVTVVAGAPGTAAETITQYFTYDQVTVTQYYTYPQQTVTETAAAVTITQAGQPLSAGTVTVVGPPAPAVTITSIAAPPPPITITVTASGVAFAPIATASPAPTLLTYAPPSAVPIAISPTPNTAIPKPASPRPVAPTSRPAPVIVPVASPVDTAPWGTSASARATPTFSASTAPLVGPVPAPPSSSTWYCRTKCDGSWGPGRTNGPSSQANIVTLPTSAGAANPSDHWGPISGYSAGSPSALRGVGGGVEDANAARAADTSATDPTIAKIKDAAYAASHKRVPTLKKPEAPQPTIATPTTLKATSRGPDTVATASPQLDDATIIALGAAEGEDLIAAPLGDFGRLEPDQLSTDSVEVENLQVNSVEEEVEEEEFDDEIKRKKKLVARQGFSWSSGPQPGPQGARPFNSPWASDQQGGQPQNWGQPIQSLNDNEASGSSCADGLDGQEPASGMCRAKQKEEEARQAQELQAELAAMQQLGPGRPLQPQAPQQPAAGGSTWWNPFTWFGSTTPAAPPASSFSS